MKKLVLILSLLTFPTLGKAQTTAELCHLQAGGYIFKNVALNGATSTRTFKFGDTACNRKVSSYEFAVFEFDFTYSSKSGNIVLTCTTGKDLKNADKTPQICVGSGTCTAMDAGIFSKAVTANKKWAVRMGIRGYASWICVVSHDGSPTASELITMNGYLTD